MKRQKIILYNPRAVFYTMPLALVAIGSNLDPTRYDVRIIDGRLEDDPLRAVLSEIDDALCVGITALTGAPLQDALRITRAVRNRRRDLPIVWGGWHASLFPMETLSERGIDVTVQGQGEETFREIVERLDAGRTLEGTTGTTVRMGDDIVTNPPRAPIDVNDLPPHNYDLIPVERYFSLKRERQLDYISSAGCFFRCAFCADPFVYGRRWSGIEPTRMADEFELLWQRYRFKDLAFQDETFFTYNDRVVEMAEEFIRRDLRFTWTATMRADQGTRLSDDHLKLCVRSGLRWLMIGVEAGSQPMLDWMQKDVTIEQIIDCAHRCAKLGIQAVFPHIVGFPGESDQSIRATLEMAKRLRRISPKFSTPIFYFKPYPGSRIVDDVVRQGFRLPQSLEEWSEFDFVAGASGPWVTPEQHRLVEQFKFYNRIAGGHRTFWQRPLQRVAQWRCERNFFRFPIEKAVVERLKPLPRLS